MKEPPATPESVLQVGQDFGEYRVEALLGAGGMGEVYAVEHRGLGVKFALKLIRPELLQDAAAEKRLEQEAAATFKLRHPRIVRVDDLGRAEGKRYLRMELVPGVPAGGERAVTLERLLELRGGRLPVAEARRYLAHMLEGLAHAHDRDVVHRDLKPANVLLSPDGAKLADFGLMKVMDPVVLGERIRLSVSHSQIVARRVSGSGGAAAASADSLNSAERSYVGTFEFMAPEQREKGEATKRSDLYAVGFMAFRMLTGQTVLGMKLPSKMVPGLDPAWDAWLARATDQEPAERFGSAEEMLRALPAAAGGKLPDALPGGQAGVTTKYTKDTKKEEGGGRRGGGEIGQSTIGNRKLKLPLLGAALAGLGLLAAAGWYFLGPEGGTARPAETAAGRPVAVAPKAAVAAPPPAVPAPAPREFVVAVDPADAGAKVWLGPKAELPVDGEGRLAVTDLPDGEHELIVQAPGYQPLTTRVTVREGRGQAEAKLVPVRGAVVVEARPGTEIIALNARGRELRVGTVPDTGTLAADTLLTIGRYEFRFVHPDCAEVRQGGVELAVGRVAKLTPAQTPLSGELRVFAVQTGAEVSVNGKRLGVTPATLRDLPSETALAVEVHQAGYRRAREVVTLKPREVRTLNVGTLAGESGGIDLRVAQRGFRWADATVRIDGREVALPAGRPVFDGLEIGSRTVEIVHADFEAWSRGVTVRDGAQTVVEVQLAPKPGRLRLRAEPREIVLQVNGRTVAAEEIPGGVLTLPAGVPLQLEISADGYRSATRTLTLAPNGSDLWEVALEKQPYPRAGQAWENTLGMKFAPVPGVPVLFGVWEVRVRDYEAFASATGRSWSKPGFTQGPEHPVGNVSWEDAQAFCGWLTEKERKEGKIGPAQRYRLPQDWEWSVAVGLNESRGGTPRSKSRQVAGVYPWGTQWPPPSGAGNYADETAKRTTHSGWTIISGYDDGYGDTAPVGSFSANRFGLYDLGGNVWEWCEDFYDGNSGARVLRGASFFDYDPDFLLSSRRGLNSAGNRYDGVGFRCGLEVESAR